MADFESVLRSVRRAGNLVEVRLRLARVLASAPAVLIVSLSLSAALLAVHKLAPNSLGQTPTLVALAVVATIALGALVAAYFWPLPKHVGTILLDRHHGLHGQLTSALEFAELPTEQQTPLMRLALEETCRLTEAKPRKAVFAAAVAAPIAVPLALLFALVPLSLLVAVAALEIRTPLPALPPEKTIDALVMSEDDLQLFRDAAKDLERPDMSPEVKAAIERFNRLIEDLANKRLERTEAFRQMESIERDLLAGTEADQKKLQEELKETAKQLEKSDLAKEVAEALKKDDKVLAEKKLKELAEKLKNTKKPDKAQLEKLRDALKKASERRKEALAAINEKRQELQEQLLKKKKEVAAEQDPNKKREEERLLQKKERELERLDREAEAQQRANRELERLDRELSQAAQDLMREMGITPEDLKNASQDLQEAAEDLNRMEREGMSQKDKEELKKRLEELRQIMRQQNQGGQKRKIRMERFAKRANGKGQGKDGQGQDGEGQEPGQGKPGQGKDGKEGEGEGQDGQGNGQRGQGKGPGQGDGQGDMTLTLGPGGVPIPMPGQGNGGDKPGNGPGQGGKEAGHGAGGPIAGNSTKGVGDTVNVDAQGQETGQGPSNSQVILSAADRGFKGGAYKKVFTDYKTVAEENINQEQIPDGYRFYIQRYFQLIRPRD